MYNHAPPDYKCPFCMYGSGTETPYNKKSDIVFEDDKSLAFISPKWWVNNPGNVIIIPKEHFENIYDVPDDLLAHLYIISKKIAMGIRSAYDCDGTSSRQHNEPGGEQDLFHFHIHVFPRHTGDKLYQNTDNFRTPTDEEKKSYADKLKKALL